MTEHEISPRLMQRIVATNAQLQVAQAQMQLLLGAVQDACSLPGPVVSMDPARGVVMCADPAEDNDALPSA
jgi:hypothetical protein